MPHFDALPPVFPPLLDAPEEPVRHFPPTRRAAPPQSDGDILTEIRPSPLISERSQRGRHVSRAIFALEKAMLLASGKLQTSITLDQIPSLLCLDVGPSKNLGLVRTGEGGVEGRGERGRVSPQISMRWLSEKLAM